MNCSRHPENLVKLSLRTIIDAVIEIKIREFCRPAHAVLAKAHFPITQL